MNSVMQGENVPSERAATVRVSHLLVADDALMPGRWGVHITLCGEQVRTPSAAAEEDDCYPNFRYCSECAAQAARWQADRASETVDHLATP